MRVAMMAVLLAVSIVPSPALSQQVGDVEQGRLYARAHCGECHGVERQEEDFSPNADAPDFSVVANTPGMTERALAVWLQTSHPTMPNLIIPEEARDDVIAYIMSLKAAKQ